MPEKARASEVREVEGKHTREGESKHATRTMSRAVVSTFSRTARLYDEPKVGELRNPGNGE
jgi:hypothetical protein